MKFFTFLCLLMLTFTGVKAQSPFYYYEGQKQPLEPNREYLYVVPSADITTEAQLRAIVGSGLITRFSADNVALSLKTTTSSRTHYWAEIRLPKTWTAEEYASYVKRISASPGIQSVSPYFKSRDEHRAGLSQYFYVKLKSEKDGSILDKLAAELNVAIVGQNQFMPLWYTLTCTAQSPQNALETANRFYESGFFAQAEPDLMASDITLSPNDSLYANQWGLKNTGQNGGAVGVDVHAEGAWDITKGSKKVVVAVLDHGFEMTHADLKENTVSLSYNTVTANSPSIIYGTHGTACAGVIAAVQDNNQGVSGIAPNASLMSISNQMTTNPGGTQQLSNGINWAWKNGAAVISNSWGNSVYKSVMMDDAISNALLSGRNGLGTIVVFAAGNSDGPVVYPANKNSGVLAVGAMSPCGERKSYSSCDGEQWSTSYGAQLDVTAPGVGIYTTDQTGSDGYYTIDYYYGFGGTSSACPMVAGVAALVLSVNPCLTRVQVSDIIEKTAQKVGGYSYAITPGRPNGTWHAEMGYGLVDAEAAVKMAQSMLPKVPTFDLFSRDRPFDNGVEPNADSGPMWLSEDIWVRQKPDGGLVHQNPKYRLFTPNAIYVKVTNRGNTASTCANLAIYFSKASTGLVWPLHWNNYFQATASGNVLHGDLINTVSIPILQPGQSYTAEISWFPPNPALFDNDAHHFCLLSRIGSPSDPMQNEQLMVGADVNARQNNNIAWKNVSVVGTLINPVAVYVRGTSQGDSRVNLRFLDAGFRETVRNRFFDRGGVIYATPDSKLMERIRQARLAGIEIMPDQTLKITSASAQISSLLLRRGETFSLRFRFEVALRPGEETVLDVVQENTVTNLFEGGERFIIRNEETEFSSTPSSLTRESALVYPNPAQSGFTVNYPVEAATSEVEISATRLDGMQPKVLLFAGKQRKGDHQEPFGTQNLIKGLYVLTVKVGSLVRTEILAVE